MSNKLALLPGEQIVSSSDNDVLVLTTERVRYNSAVWGRANLISITLDAVASCGIVTRSYPLLLILTAIASIAAVASIFTFGETMFVSLLTVAGALVVGYFLSRRAVISIASSGGEAI